MKDINVNISTKASIVAGGLILLILAGAVGWVYKEMSSMRRDLYGVRGDYYGYASEEDNQQGAGEVEYALVSQEVKQLRVANYDKVDYESGPDYETKPVRVVELRVKNNQDYLFSYYDYGIATVGEGGVLDHGVEVHPDDNQNEWTDKGSLELIPGGEATIFVYLDDTGEEVTSLYNTEWGEEIKLK